MAAEETLNKPSLSWHYPTILGIVSLAAYGVLYYLSGEGLKPGLPEDQNITYFLVIYAGLFLLYLCLIVPLIKGFCLSKHAFGVAILFAVLFRVVLLPSDLILENDIYRYMWDGKMMMEGINPYRFPPSSPELDNHETWYRDSINYPYIRTIYPPTLQVIFSAPQFLFPANVIGMKTVLVVFDLGTIALFWLLLAKLNRPPCWIMIYAWSPLVLKEIANSGHADSVSACLLVALMLFIAHHRLWSSAVVMALMTLTKFFGVFLLPVLFRIWSWKQYVLYFALIMVLYLPFIYTLDVNPLDGFLTYSKEWRFNAGVFAWLEKGIESLGGEFFYQSNMVTRYILFGFIILVTLVQSIKCFRNQESETVFRSFFIILGTLMVCSPVIDPWYLTWLVPFLCLFPNRAWILFTGLVFLSYTFYYDKHFPYWVKWVEYVPFLGLLFYDAMALWWRNRKNKCLETMHS